MYLELSADEVLTTTRAVRKRLDLNRPIERSVLLECTDIAFQAPTGSNAQGWHFLFVEDPDKQDAEGEPLYKMKYGPKHNRKYDWEGMKKYQTPNTPHRQPSRKYCVPAHY